MRVRSIEEEIEHIKYVMQFVSIDCEAGSIKWSQNRGGKAKIGQEWGNIMDRFNKSSSYRGSVMRPFGTHGKRVFALAHRIIYYAHHKSLPEVIDHIDGNGLNNAICNLRACTHSENLRNHKLSKANKTGVSGVHRSETKTRGPRWSTTIGYKGKGIFLGRFPSFEQAVKARKEAELLYHKQFVPINN